MAPSLIRKRLARYLMVSWREQPTRYDIEALQANIRRVGLVIRVRWILIVVLVVYSAGAAGLYVTDMSVAELASLMWIPAMALGFVVLYNSFYALNYRKLGNIVVWNNLQLLLDAIVVTVLVYFSGGVNSWFWSMYSLFILEATFILPRSRSAWLVAFTCAMMLGGVELSELFQLIPHQTIPFAETPVHLDVVYVAVRYTWQLAVLFGTAWVSILLVGEFRRELASRAAQTIIDVTTGLYSRGYFMRALPAELSRAQRDNRPMHILIIDIDDFGDFNRRFGFDAGDRLLKALAGAFSSTVALAGDLMTTTNVAARIGGEEFAVLLSEDHRLGGPPTAADAARMAEQLRTIAEAVRIADAGVTISVGVASWPADGGSSEELLDAADSALVLASQAGGNRVLIASEIAEPEDAPVRRDFDI